MLKGISFFVLMVFAATCFAGANTEHAAAVTILKADLAGMKLVTKTAGGKEETFLFTSKTPVSSLADAGISKNLAGGVGYQFIIRYTDSAVEGKVATAIDYVGKEGWKTFTGVLDSVDPAGKTILAKTPEGIEGKFFAGSRCVIETLDGAKSFTDWAQTVAPQGADKVAVHYTVDIRRKIFYVLDYNLD